MTLRPGLQGEPLPSGEIVIRAAMAPSGFEETGEIDAAAFELSSEDGATPLQSLSVWAEQLTTKEQARHLMGRNKEKYRLALYLNVDDVRAARPTPESPDVPYLDVVWDPRDIVQEGNRIPDPQPGAAGHAGITGLNRPSGLPNARLYYKSLREELVRRVQAIEWIE